DPTAHANVLFTLLYDSTLSAEALALQHRAWARRFADPLASSMPTEHVNAREPNRRLRIGYVSAGFREHSVARFLEPMLSHRDPEQFEVICYSDVVRMDATTERFRAACDQWKNVKALPDAKLAQVIRDDGIDVLVDPTGHMGNN